MPCRAICPKDAFGDGAFSKPECMKQMAEDEARAFQPEDIEPGGAQAVVYIPYCRACEIVCSTV